MSGYRAEFKKKVARMFAITVTTWMKISAIATAVAAVAALVTAVVAAIGSFATRDTVRTMRAQWERDRLDRAAEQRLSRISLVSTLYNECDVIRHTYRDGSQAPLSMDEWKRSRAEIALIDEELAGLMAGLEMQVERHNGWNRMSADTVYGPTLDNFRARVVAAHPDERPALQEEYPRIVKEMADDAKMRYAETLLTVDDAMKRLAAIYKALKERGGGGRSKKTD